jgi:hypothetical protein
MRNRIEVESRQIGIFCLNERQDNILKWLYTRLTMKDDEDL